MLLRSIKYEIGGLDAMYWKAERSRGTAGRDLASDAMLFFVRDGCEMVEGEMQRLELYTVRRFTPQSFPSGVLGGGKL